MDEGRKADIKELEKARKTAPDKETLDNIDKVRETIKAEQHSGYLRGARKSMIKEAKRGGKENVRDAQEYLTNKKDKGGVVRKSYFFSLPDHLR
jgi:hypothetical protein